METKQATNRMFQIATEIAATHVVEVAGRTFHMWVSWTREGERFNLGIDRNYYVTRKVATDALAAARKEIAKRLKEEGIAWRYATQRAAGGGKTWIHTTGFEHMGRIEETKRWAVFVGPAA